MQLDVSLNDPFKYSTLPLIICIILMVVLIVLFILLNLKKKRKPVVKPIIKQEIIVPKDINSIKNKYLQQLDELTNSINSTPKRKLYNKLSIIIRSFVLEVTSIDVLKYSLSEIAHLKMDELTKLVTEYYEPEFSRNSNADITISINNTREVIKKWR